MMKTQLKLKVMAAILTLCGATGAVVSYAIGGWYETVMSLFRKRPNRLCLFKGSYDLIESHTPSDKIHSQDLVEEIIKGNFKK